MKIKLSHNRLYCTSHTFTQMAYSGKELKTKKKGSDRQGMGEGTTSPGPGGFGRTRKSVSGVSCSINISPNSCILRNVSLGSECYDMYCH